MSTREWTERVQDILDAIGEINSYTAGMGFDAFQDVETRIGLASKEENL